MVIENSFILVIGSYNEQVNLPSAACGKFSADLVDLELSEVDAELCQDGAEILPGNASGTFRIQLEKFLLQIIPQIIYLETQRKEV